MWKTFGHTHSIHLLATCLPLDTTSLAGHLDTSWWQQCNIYWFLLGLQLWFCIHGVWLWRIPGPLRWLLLLCTMGLLQTLHFCSPQTFEKMLTHFQNCQSTFNWISQNSHVYRFFFQSLSALVLETLAVEIVKLKNRWMILLMLILVLRRKLTCS